MTLENLDKANKLAARIAAAKSNIERFRNSTTICTVINLCDREIDSEVEAIDLKVKEFAGKALTAHLKKLEAQFKAL